MSRRAPVVALYGYFGMGNIGNEASFAALLSQVRRHRPDVAVRALVADADEVRGRHGVPAVQLMSHRRRSPGAGGLELVRKVAGRLIDVPRTWALLQDVDLLVVPGTGVLETQFRTRAWGLPYWMFLATAACRARGGQVALVDVGAERASDRLTRLLFRATVRMAAHVSVRDHASRDVVRSYGREASVMPDLAFLLPVPPCPPVRPGRVVIGVMVYEGASDDPDRGPHVVAAYAERMADVVARLAATGRSVVLVIGDVADLGLAHEVLEKATLRCDRVTGLVRVSGAETLEDLMIEVAQAEVAVVSRFHNLIAALKVARPVVSLSYAGKSGALMEEFGAHEHVQPIDSFDVDLLMDQVEACRQGERDFSVTAERVLRYYEAELGDRVSRLLDALLPSPDRARGPQQGQRRRGALLPARR